jgi:hypothetical protein
MTKKGLRQTDSKHGDNKGSRRNDNQSDEIIDDERFSSVLSAPLFKKMSAEKNKVVLDDRFKGVLTDERFRILPGGDIDAYGRKIKKKKSSTQALKELENFYTSTDPSTTVSEEVENKEQEQAPESVGKKIKKGHVEKKQPQTDEERLDYLNRLARGEISDEEDDGSDSEEDRDDDNMEVSDEEEEEEEDEDYEALSNKKSPLDLPGDDEIEFGEATKRISILNCDWENIKSDDLMYVHLSLFFPL